MEVRGNLKADNIIKQMVNVAKKFLDPHMAVSETMYEAIDLPFVNGINGLIGKSVNYKKEKKFLLR